MQFKRMAAVVAAAVAGPTVLMAAPAMAAEQPAVIVPDAIPKDEAAAGPQEQEQKRAESGAEAGPAAEPEDEAGAGTGHQAGPKDAAEADAGPRAQAAPATETTTETTATPAAVAAPAAAGGAASAEATEAAEGEQDTETGRILMGPEVTVQGIPKDGFKADGSWTPLTVTVDNSGHVAVPDYTPVLGILQGGGKFTASQIKVEHRVTDGAGNQTWQPAGPVPAGEAGSGFGYALGTAASVPVGTVYGIDVRVSFAADTPVVAFDLTSDGRSSVGNTTSSSPTSSYETRIAGAPGGDEDPVFTEGPALTVNGVPESVEAGGDWTGLSVRVDNTGKSELKSFNLGLVVARPDFVPMESSQIAVEVYRTGEDGQPGWHPVVIQSAEDGYFFAADLAGGPVAAGQSFDVQVRIRFSAGTPTGSVSFFAWGTSQVDAETPAPWANSRSKPRLTTLRIADANPGGETPGDETPGGETPGGGTPGGETPGGGAPGSGTPGAPNTGGGNGNQPNPNGSATPIPHTGGGTGGTNGSTTGTGTGTDGAELAATGADPASSWALGGAGAALVMGAALVAGTGRHRRRRTG